MRKTPPTREHLKRAAMVCLRNLRRATGIAQEKLALQSGIDRTYMSGLERGLYVPSIYMIYRLAPALGVSFVQFAQEFDQTLRRLRRNHD